MSLLDAEQEARVAAAIAAVETRTDAELVTVLAPRADDYFYIPALWAAFVALLTPWLLSLSHLWLEAIDLLIAQLGAFFVLAVLLRLPPILYRLIPKRVRTWRASSLARRQFLEQGLHHTEGETGLLIFVSEAEHFVEILADRGISRFVDDSRWQDIVDGFSAKVRSGQTLEGFVDCIERCGALLEEHVPATREKNELPNHLVVLGR